MAWTGSQCDIEIARKAAGSALMGQTQFGVLEASLSSVTAAEVAVLANSLTYSICDRELARSVVRGYRVASDMGATYSSSYATFYASLPDSSQHQRDMIQG